MYHSITFGDKNTWDDWHLVPSSRPLFNPPAVKTKFVDLPGASGIVDMSDSLTKYPVFNNREGSIEFYVMNDYWEWYDAYSTIMNYLHGKYMKAILEDDPEYYYIGRFSVNSWSSEKDYSKIVIDYNVKPYKFSVEGVLEGNWLWDPFSFETGIVPDSLFGNIPVSVTEPVTMEYNYIEYGEMPVRPRFIVSTPMTMHFVNSTLNVDETVQLNADINNEFDDLLFYGPSVRITFSIDPDNPETEGKVSIDFERGSL